MNEKYKFFGEDPVICYYCGRPVLKWTSADRNGKYACIKCAAKMRAKCQVVEAVAD